MSARGPGVDVRRLMDASPERVFAAFADKSLVARWLRPSPDVKLTVLAFDFRPGGRGVGRLQLSEPRSFERRGVPGGAVRLRDRVYEPLDERALRWMRPRVRSSRHVQRNARTVHMRGSCHLLPREIARVR